jgi:hypothetical protein
MARSSPTGAWRRQGHKIEVEEAMLDERRRAAGSAAWANLPHPAHNTPLAATPSTPPHTQVAYALCVRTKTCNLADSRTTSYLKLKIANHAATMMSMFRAAATVVCRCRHNPTRLISKRHLTTCSLAVSNSRFLSSVARNQSDLAAPPSQRTSRDAYWNKMYKKFQHYVEQHGHARVPFQYSENPSLGRWVDAQRRQYRLLRDGKKTILSQERLELLNQLGMIWNIRDYSWEERYEELLEYYYQHGHVNVPLRFRELGNWVYKQRSDFKARQRGEATQMTTERMVQLSVLGMVWDIPKESWDESYRKLVEFHMTHGHTNVPINVEDSFSLWVHIQRREYRKFKAGEYSRITQERIDRLNRLNFVWEKQKADWVLKYQELCRYRQEHGNW